MILVFLVVSILLIILGCWINSKDKYAENGTGFVVFGTVATILTVIAIVFLLANVSSSFTIDEKIEMYQKENQNIETSITKVVENYKDYEKEIFENVKPEEVVLVATQVYPELKSNTLVEKQIDVYLKNNKSDKKNVNNSKLRVCMDFEESKLDDIICHGFIYEYNLKKKGV